MEQINFFENSLFYEKVEKTFSEHKKLIKERMPEASSHWKFRCP